MFGRLINPFRPNIRDNAGNDDYADDATGVAAQLDASQITEVSESQYRGMFESFDHERALAQKILGMAPAKPVKWFIISKTSENSFPALGHVRESADRNAYEIFIREDMIDTGKAAHEIVAASVLIGSPALVHGLATEIEAMVRRLIEEETDVERVDRDELRRSLSETSQELLVSAQAKSGLPVRTFVEYTREAHIRDLSILGLPVKTGVDRKPLEIRLREARVIKFLANGKLDNSVPFRVTNEEVARFIKTVQRRGTDTERYKMTGDERVVTAYTLALLSLFEGKLDMERLQQVNADNLRNTLSIPTMRAFAQRPAGFVLKLQGYGIEVPCAPGMMLLVNPGEANTILRVDQNEQGYRLYRANARGEKLPGRTLAFDEAQGSLLVIGSKPAELEGPQGALAIVGAKEGTYISRAAKDASLVSLSESSRGACEVAILENDYVSIMLTGGSQVKVSVAVGLLDITARPATAEATGRARVSAIVRVYNFGISLLFQTLIFFRKTVSAYRSVSYDAGSDRNAAGFKVSQARLRPQKVLAVPDKLSVPTAIRLVPARYSDAKARAVMVATRKIAEGIRENLPFDIKIEIAPEIKLGDYLAGSAATFSRHKGKFILPFYGSEMPSRSIPTLLVTDVDITGLTLEGIVLKYLFGRAYPDSNLVVMSLYRLFAADAANYSQRLIKIALHELGHLFGLGSEEMLLSAGEHCENSTCFMHVLRTVEEIDKAHVQLCPECRARITTSVSVKATTGSKDSGIVDGSTHFGLSEDRPLPGIVPTTTAIDAPVKVSRNGKDFHILSLASAPQALRQKYIKGVIAVMKACRIGDADFILDDHEYVFVAVDADDKVVGAAQWKPVEDCEKSTQLLAVLPGFNNYGIGSALFNKVLGRARQDGLRKVFIVTNEYSWEWFRRRGAVLIGADKYGLATFLYYDLSKKTKRSAKSAGRGVSGQRLINNCLMQYYVQRENQPAIVALAEGVAAHEARTRFDKMTLMAPALQARAIHKALGEIAESTDNIMLTVTARSSDGSILYHVDPQGTLPLSAVRGAHEWVGAPVEGMVVLKTGP
ncbi:MAG: GNAT family N-acetyltransferase, partial [Candidatus Omnitrophota bacterium]